MNKLISFIKSLQFAKILVILIASMTLFLATACNPGNVQGARPNNPPVQMGGQNNPHKQGGDGYTQYKMTTDPNIKANRTYKGS